MKTVFKFLILFVLSLSSAFALNYAIPGMGSQQSFALTLGIESQAAFICLLLKWFCFDDEYVKHEENN